MSFRSLVTGAAGFIGANLVRVLLQRGDTVYALIRPKGNLWRLGDVADRIRFCYADISDADSVKNIVREVQPEHVFHLAHYGGNRGQTDPKEIRRTVIEGTAALYEACAEVDGCRAIIHASSSSEYGPKANAMVETMVLEPNTEYGAAKAWATLYGRHLARERGMPIVILRLFHVYGPFEARERLVPAVILSCLRGHSPPLANPSTVRDFVYVEDVVDVMLAASQKPMPGGIFNVGTGKETSLKEAVELIVRIIGKDVQLEWGSLPAYSFDTTTWRADTRHTESVLGWRASHSLEQGIEKTIAWFKTNQHLYVNT